MDLITLNRQLLTAQSRAIFIILIAITLIASIPLNPHRQTLEKKQLKININKADIETLKTLPYIGEERARLIIQIRESKGYFISFEELKFIPNFDKVEPYIKLED